MAGENVLVHLKTQKGKGYEPAEENPGKFHGISPTKSAAVADSFSLKFGEALCGLAKENERICAITAAMGAGTGLERFEESFKERFFDVGIAEEHAVTFASGLAANGLLPVFAVYSTFLQRGYDQIIHDAALQKLPLVLGIDRAGLNNSDGVTHHGIFDVAFLSELPNVKIYTPITYDGLARSLKQAISEDGVKAIRYPSGSENEALVKAFYCEGANEKIGVRTNFDINDTPENIIVTHGRMSLECLEAQKLLENEGIRAGIMLCEYIAPYAALADEINSLISDKNVKSITFVEEEIRAGGFGMMLSDEIKRRGSFKSAKFNVMATNDPFVTRNEGQTYLEVAGLSAKDIAYTIKQKD